MHLHAQDTEFLGCNLSVVQNGCRNRICKTLPVAWRNAQGRLKAVGSLGLPQLMQIEMRNEMYSHNIASATAGLSVVFLCLFVLFYCFNIVLSLLQNSKAQEN